MTDSNDLLAEMKIIIAKDKIKDTLYKYCRGVDRCDLELLRSCYWPDSFDDHGRFFSGNGYEFCEKIIPVLKQIESTTHSVGNFLIDVDGDRAFSECQWSIVHRFREPNCLLDWHHQGRYLNIFECRDGEWKIKVHRIVKTSDRLHITRDMDDAMREAGILKTEETVPVLWGDRFPNDPVYQGFNIGDDVTERPALDAATFWDALRNLKHVMHPTP